MIVAPCGSGKSYLFAKMIEQSKGETLVLVHRRELIKQHKELLADYSDKVRVESIFTEANHLGEHAQPKLIVLDECHLSMANSWVKVIDFYNTFCVGFTATPCRLDNRPLGDIYDTMITAPSVKELIDMKCLAPYEYYAPTLVDTTALTSQYGDFNSNETEQLMMNKAIYGDILENYKRFANGKKTIAYCASVNHSKSIAKLFNDAGIVAAHIDGKTPKAEREQIMEQFRNGNITILCNYSIIAEGISISDCECCLLLRPTDSLALHIQSSMRCMRYLPNKTATIIDCVGNYARHGLPDEDRKWSLDKPIKKKAEFNSNGEFTIRQCLNCYKTFKTKPICPYCGTPYPLHEREIKQRKDIELKKLSEDEKAELEKKRKQARIEVGMARTRFELEVIARARGYQSGWVWQQMKIKGIRR